MAVPVLLKKEILDAMLSIGKPASIKEIESLVSLERHTLSKYLMILKREGVLDFDAVGQAKLWYVDSAPLATIFSADLAGMSFAERMLSEVIHAVPAGIAVLDADRKVQFMNDMLTRLLEDPQGHDFCRMVLGRHDRACSEQLERLIRRERDIVRFDMKTETGLVLDVNASALENPDGRRSVVVILHDVTAQKKAFEERTLLASIVQNTLAGIVGTNTEGIITSWNTGAQRLYGYTAAEILGKPFTTLSPPELHEEIARVHARLNQGETLEQFETVRLAKDGSRVSVVASASPITSHDGTIVGASRVDHDVSELKRRSHQRQAIADVGMMALSARNLDELFRTAAERLAAAMETEYCQVVQLHGEMLRIRAGVGLRDLGVAELGPDSQAGYTVRAQSPVVVVDLATEGRFKDTARLRAHGVVSGVSVVIGEASAPWGVLTVHTRKRREFSQNDVNALQSIASVLALAIQKQQHRDNLLLTREERDQQQLLFRATVEKAPVGIAHVDLEGKFLLINDAMLSITGYGRDELMKRTFMEVTHPQDLYRTMHNFHTLLNGQISRYELDTRIVKKGGATAWIHVVVSLIHDAQGNPWRVLGVLEDITPRKQAEDVLSRTSKFERSFLDIAQGIVLVLDADGKVARINLEGAKLLGYTIAELEHQDWFDLCVPAQRREEARGAFFQILSGRLHEANAEQYENPVLTKRGEQINVQWHNTYLRDNGDIVGTISSGQPI